MDTLHLAYPFCMFAYLTVSAGYAAVLSISGFDEIQDFFFGRHYTKSTFACSDQGSCGIGKCQQLF